MNREEWLEKRREMLTASDVAAVLGVDPRRGPLAVYESKVTGYSQEDNDWFAFGRDVEGAIANLYASKTERTVEDRGATKIITHPKITWLGATLDRMTWKDEDLPLNGGPLELKHVGNFARPDVWAEDPPLHYQIQLQIQMACASAHWGSLAGMFPGYQLAWKDFERDDELLESVYPILGEFWQRVQRKDPPPADVLPGTLDVVKRMYGKEDGETVSLDCLDLVDEWEKEKEAEKTAAKKKKEIEIQLRDRMKTATFGALNDGTILTLKTTKRKAYTKTVEASEFRTLRRTRPKGK